MADDIMNLRKLSEILGLSQTTVSRALNGFPEVSERTRKKVIEAAKVHNYRPSQSAASLATGRTKVIGHVVPLAEHSMINPHFSDFIAGAGEAYARYGYDMLFRVATEQEEESVYRDLAAGRRVDGFVVQAPATNDHRIELLHSLEIPFVVHGRTGHPEDSYSWIDVNNRSAFRRATRFLTDLGHHRIALVNGLESMNFAARRRQGYEDGLAEAGIKPDPSLIFSADMIEPYGYRVATQLLERSEVPTAFLCSSVLPAMGVLRALGEKNLTAGSDISIIIFDDRLSFLQSSGPEFPIPYFTAMRSSIREAGGALAHMLVDCIDNPQTIPRHALWEAELVVGQTTGPVPN